MRWCWYGYVHDFLVTQGKSGWGANEGKRNYLKGIDWRRAARKRPHLEF